MTGKELLAYLESTYEAMSKKTDENPSEYTSRHQLRLEGFDTALWFARRALTAVEAEATL